MSAEKASRQDVKDALVQLGGRKNTSLRKLRNAVGGGSYTTLSKHLDASEAQEKLTDNMPQAIIKIFDESRDRCFVELSAYLSQEVRKEVVHFSSLCDFLGEEIEKANEEKSAVNDLLERERDARIAAENEVAILRQTVEKFAEDLEGAKNNLQRARLELSLSKDQHRAAINELDQLKNERAGDAAGIMHRLLLIEKRLPQTPPDMQE